MQGTHYGVGPGARWFGGDQDLEILESEGVLITGIIADTPAQTAQLQRGDIILSVNGQKVNTRQEIDELLATLEAGQEIRLEIKRGTETITKRLTLETRLFRPHIGVITQNSGRMPFQGFYGFGMDQFIGTDAVVILSVQTDSPAAKAGLTPGMLITGVNGTPLQSTDIASLISELNPGDPLTLAVQNQRTAEEQKEVTVTLAEKAGKAYLGIQYRPIPSATNMIRSMMGQGMMGPNNRGSNFQNIPGRGRR
jgi:S1-C subfamily serine protease